MMIYSRNSNDKIVHKSHCTYIKRMSHKNISHFETIEDAKAAGYHLCKCCVPMWSYYSKEYYKIKDFASQNGLAIDYVDGEIIVQTPYSNWKIIVNGQKNYIWLYHKNTYNRCKDRNDLVPGYHSQSIRKSTLMGYLTYIAEHDAYRLSHPELPKKEQSHKKLNKHEVKKRKKREHYQSVMRVLALLENEANYRQMQAAR